MSKIITCEQVSNGHPDKICDQIADAIVTDILQHDRNARVAIECLLKKSQLFIAGEVTTDYRPNYNQIVHDVLARIGAEKLGWTLTELGSSSRRGLKKTRLRNSGHLLRTSCTPSGARKTDTRPKTRKTSKMPSVCISK